MKKTPIMKRISKAAKNEDGYILMMGLFVMMLLFLMGIALAVMGIQEFELASRVKMMDQAYLIADAGVNSAAVALETNTTAKETKTPVFPDTGGSGILTGTTPFSGGEFTYTVYQSNEFPDDAGYKVIKSKGTIEKQGKKVERIILARILLPAGGLDYDASFDYLMFNGMDSNGDGTSEHGLWAPTDLRFGSLAIGNFTFDGSASFQGHSPKGAIYVDGSLEIPTSIIGDVFLKGNIVAMDNIDLSNEWGLNISDNGIKLSLGNVVAGLDGSGYATVKASKGLITGASAINISGNVCPR